MALCALTSLFEGGGLPYGKSEGVSKLCCCVFLFWDTPSVTASAATAPSGREPRVGALYEPHRQIGIYFLLPLVQSAVLVVQKQLLDFAICKNSVYNPLYILRCLCYNDRTQWCSVGFLRPNYIMPL